MHRGKVVIIGAGISGLAIALLLEHMGIEVKIYEREAVIQHIGGGLGIWPNGSEVLHQLFGTYIQQLSGQLPSNNITTATSFGERLSTTPTAIFREISDFPNLFICRSELQKKLLSSLKRTQIIWGKRCQRVVSNDHNVTLTFSDGEEISCDLLIAADGVYSTIRRQLFNQFQLDYTGYLTIGGIIPDNRLPDNYSNITIAPQYMHLLFPVAQNRHYQFIARSYSYANLTKLSADRDQQLQLFKGWSPMIDHVLDALGAAAETNNEHYFCLPAYDMILLPQFHQQRIVLIGDAAHPIGPLLGLGTSLALCGAACLAQALQQQLELSDALEVYSKQQRLLANNMLRVEAQEKETLLRENHEAFLLRCNKMQTTPPQQAWQDFILAFKARVLNTNCT